MAMPSPSWTHDMDGLWGWSHHRQLFKALLESFGNPSMHGTCWCASIATPSGMRVGALSIATEIGFSETCNSKGWATVLPPCLTMRVPLNPALCWIPVDKNQIFFQILKQLRDPPMFLPPSTMKEKAPSCTGAHSQEKEPQASQEHSVYVHLSSHVFPSFGESFWGSGWVPPQWTGWHWIHLRNRLCSGFPCSDLYLHILYPLCRKLKRISSQFRAVVTCKGAGP